MIYSNINFDFNEHIVLVSGGSRGIGKGVVDAFLLSGAKVLYASRHPMKNAESSDAIHIPIDLSEKADALIQWFGSYHQKIHVLSEMNKTIACTVSKAQEELGYSPEYSLEKGMESSLAEVYN